MKILIFIFNYDINKANINVIFHKKIVINYFFSFKNDLNIIFVIFLFLKFFNKIKT